MKNVPADRFEIRTGIQIKQTNKTLKQQRPAVSLEEKGDGIGATSAAIELLRDEGFDATTAEKLASKYAIEQIIHQIEWIDERHVRQNRIGMLRKAIEQDWSKPTAEKLRRRNSAPAEPDELAEAREALGRQFNSFPS